MINHEDMLMRTIQSVEACNLAELLPIDVYAWFENHKAEELRQEELAKTEVQKFCERQVERWKQKESAGICSVPPRSRTV